MHSSLTISAEGEQLLPPPGGTHSDPASSGCFGWLDPVSRRRGYVHTGSDGEEEEEEDRPRHARVGSSQSMKIGGGNKKDGKLSKSMSLPLSHMAPDPFPELANSPVTPIVTSSIDRTGREQQASRSSPASPILRGSSFQTPTSPPWCYTRLPDSERSDSENVIWSPSAGNFGKTMLNFYTDDKSHRSVLVEDSMSASDVGYLLALRNHTVDDKTWAVVENISKFQLERSLEDHELVLQVYRSWGHTEENRFYFKKDFRKYEIFRNPTFFPSHMLDIKGLKVNVPELISRPEQQRRILLQNLLESCDPLPDVQGQLYLREGKKSWKKHYFVLRQSGFYYSSKGTSKDPRYLVLLSHLSNMNIYLANNAKKVLGAPNQYAFCLKPTYSVNDIRQMKCFCAEDEQSRACWMSGLRLVKYGMQLRENYKLAVKREEKLQSIENRGVGPHGSDSLYVKSRVAMDFTGRGGRVVGDPGEAMGVATEEVHSWRKKMSLLASFGVQPKVNPAQAEYALRTKQTIALSLHMSQPWFHSGVSREEAVDIIAEQGQVDGLFLMRESQSLPGTYVLSLVHNQKVKHCQIHQGQMESDGEIYFSLDGGQTRFSDLLQLVEFYQLNAGGLPTRLTHPVTRLT